MAKKSTTINISIDKDKKATLAGKHAIFFIFKSDVKEKSLCTLQDLVFE
jgi:hypothetical protein